MTAIDGPPGGGQARQARHRKLLRPARIRRSSGLSRPSRSNIPGVSATSARIARHVLAIHDLVVGEHLDAWPNAVAASQIEELQRFANGLERTKLLSSWD
jgi:hypothetical protein